LPGRARCSRAPSATRGGPSPACYAPTTAASPSQAPRTYGRINKEEAARRRHWRRGEVACGRRGGGGEGRRGVLGGSGGVGGIRGINEGGAVWADWPNWRGRSAEAFSLRGRGRSADALGRCISSCPPAGARLPVVETHFK
jgi:hypothetical protein